MCSIVAVLSLLLFTKYQNFLWACWFVGKNLTILLTATLWLLFAIISGIYTYHNVSITADDIPNDTNVIILIPIRWKSLDLRNAMRDMFASGAKNTILKYKLIFSFNFDAGNNSGNFEQNIDKSVLKNPHI